MSKAQSWPLHHCEFQTVLPNWVSNVKILLYDILECLCCRSQNILLKFSISNFEKVEHIIATNLSLPYIDKSHLLRATFVTFVTCDHVGFTFTALLPGWYGKRFSLMKGTPEERCFHCSILSVQVLCCKTGNPSTCQSPSLGHGNYITASAVLKFLSFKSPEFLHRTRRNVYFLNVLQLPNWTSAWRFGQYSF